MNQSVRARVLALSAIIASVALLAVTWLAAAFPVAAQTATATPTATATATPVPPASLALGTATSSTLGTYLTGPNGDTLYWLSSDTATGTTCTGGCIGFWPPLYVAPGGSVTAPSVVTGALTQFTRADTGGTQVSYDGHPLYYFANDTAPGQTNGEGIQAFGGTWHVAAVTAAATPTPTATATATPVPPASLALGTATSSTLGTYLTGPNGHTLYWLSSDTASGTTCTGGCVGVWPPLYVAPGGSVTAPSVATGALTQFTRADTGGTQVSYDGHPLYYFAHDTAAGQTNGEGFNALGGTWHVVTLVAAATATPLTATAAPTNSVLPATSTSNGQSGTVGGGTLLVVVIGLLAVALAVALTSLLPRRMHRR